MLGRDLLPELGADLVAALADAERDDLLHFCVGGVCALGARALSSCLRYQLVRRFVSLGQRLGAAGVLQLCNRSSYEQLARKAGGGKILSLAGLASVSYTARKNS